MNFICFVFCCCCSDSAIEWHFICCAAASGWIILLWYNSSVDSIETQSLQGIRCFESRWGGHPYTSTASKKTKNSSTWWINWFWHTKWYESLASVFLLLLLWIFGRFPYQLLLSFQWMFQIQKYRKINKFLICKHNNVSTSCSSGHSRHYNNNGNNSSRNSSSSGSSSRLSKHPILRKFCCHSLVLKSIESFWSWYFLGVSNTIW